MWIRIDVDEPLAHRGRPLHLQRVSRLALLGVSACGVV